jgi:putative Holliday junction resolvase
MPDPEQTSRNLIALDYGLRRIGVAAGTIITGTATPLTTIRASNGVPEWDELDKIIHEWAPDVLVLGLPCNSDGSDSEMTTAVRDFAAILGPRYKLQVELADERYTSVEAKNILRDQRQQGLRSKKLKKEDVDALAAQLIAESWMRNTGATPPS